MVIYILARGYILRKEVYLSFVGYFPCNDACTVTQV